MSCWRSEDVIIASRARWDITPLDSTLMVFSTRHQIWTRFYYKVSNVFKYITENVLENTFQGHDAASATAQPNMIDHYQIVGGSLSVWSNRDAHTTHGPEYSYHLPRR